MKIKRRNNNLFSLILFCIISSSCVSLKEGTFELMEEGESIGYLYRYKNIQAEKYFDKNVLTFAEVKWINNHVMLLRSLSRKENSIDTITWRVDFSNSITSNRFDGVVKAAYLDTLNHKYKFTIKKIDNKIDKNIKENILQVRKNLK